MLPIVVDPEMVAIGLVARDGLGLRRMRMLEEAGVVGLNIFSDAPSKEFEQQAKDRLIPRLPDRSDLEALSVLFIADLSPEEADPIAREARALSTLVNTEDIRSGCDFHVPAIVRRGDLTFSVSTAGRSPALARCLREYLEETFDPHWSDHVDEIADLRKVWRENGVSLEEFSPRTRAHIANKGWFS